MAREPFHFSLEPERLAVEADLDSLVAEEVRRKRALQDEEAALARARDAVEEVARALRAHHEQEVRGAGRAVTADEWTARNEELDDLRRRQAEARLECEERAVRVREARHSLRNLGRRVDRKRLELEQLERVREEQRRAWRRQRDLHAEKRRDEEAQTRWTYDRRERPRG